uniref:FANCM protein n=1 Tax=Ficedula albicollis TaxID=59894 RepID=A0A803VUC9_FICAL
MQAAGRHFLEEEAELSQLDAEGISSDESDTGEELSPSLAQFLDDEGEPTQALNDSEMRAVYLSSVRSPALGSRSSKTFAVLQNFLGLFSPQIPEQDSAYAEDSFCVGDEEEEAQSGCSEEEPCVSFDLLPEGCSSRGRYLTRRRRRLEQAGNGPAPGRRRKPSRVIVLSDSSEEEQPAARREKPLAAGQGKEQLPRALPSAPPGRQGSRAGAGAAPQQQSPSLAGISRVPGEQSPSLAGISRVPEDHSPSLAGISRVPGDHSPSLCILADSREISSGPEVISSLRAVHGLRVQVCSLGSSDYIVSNRLAVDRLLQSELQSICFNPKIQTRTQYYDGVLSALVQAGIKILFSSCQQESAALLKELALLEHRKDAAIQVPTEPEGHRRELLNFYLSIPNLSYAAALNLCHSFSSITAVANR